MESSTNNTPRTWTVYMHTNKINGKRYIGITSFTAEERWRHGKGYTTGYFKNAISKYGWDAFEHEILFTDLSEDDAKGKEVELIAKYNTQDKNYGYNLTAGGDGIVGFKFSEESRAKMSESAKNKVIDYSKVRPHPPITEETRQKMSKNNTGAGNPNYGRKHTEEELEKMSATHRKEVGLLDDFGNVVMIFQSTVEAGEYFGVCKTTVAKCCRGVLKSCKGMKFVYV